MDLARLQARFQQALVDGDDAALKDIVDSPKEQRDVLLGVYRNAYVLRLIDFLRGDYPKLHAFLGDEQFDVLARDFIGLHPSQTPNARWFGQRLPEYLASAEIYEQREALSELAALERALNDVFDAADAPSLALANLAEIPADEWADLTFTPHPAVRRLDQQTNATDIWRAIKQETACPEPQLRAEVLQLLVSRSGGTVNFRPMAPDEAMMWDEAAAGARFSDLCERLAISVGEDAAVMQAAGYLQTWIGAGLIARNGEPL